MATGERSEYVVVKKQILAMGSELVGTPAARYFYEKASEGVIQDAKALLESGLITGSEYQQITDLRTSIENSMIP